MMTIEGLNSAVADGSFNGLVQVAEALHDRCLVEMAGEIAARRMVRLVLVAGPSSAGKTTFAMRLTYHLRARGLNPLLLSTDDYFVGDARNPRDADGNLDYEHIEAMDMPRLNADLTGLFAGRAVRLRNFDFSTKTGYDDETPTTLPFGEVVVMEGLHCLNPRLTSDIPDEQKYRAYVRLLPRLAFADGSRVSSTSLRLARRIARDSLFRNTPARETIALWPMVRRGEEKWIFPFEDNADAVYNSALEYEASVLKPIVSPLLEAIEPSDPSYDEAQDLLGFLSRFADASAGAIPGDSLLREYIGGSCLQY